MWVGADDADFDYEDYADKESVAQGEDEDGDLADTTAKITTGKSSSSGAGATTTRSSRVMIETDGDKKGGLNADTEDLPILRRTEGGSKESSSSNNKAGSKKP